MKKYISILLAAVMAVCCLSACGQNNCFLQALFPQKCRVTSSKLHGEFPQYCISPSSTLLGAGEEPLQAYKVY